jgi:hypothetical protein
MATGFSPNREYWGNWISYDGHSRIHLHDDDGIGWIYGAGIV